ncbi:MAG TPA: hypothetical protein VNO32_17930 [Candidatus Acidoferrum sp.]|jgi:hypothetical protein|nr:hypothetical protein [Candidatus Acidoferrum sp.]
MAADIETIRCNFIGDFKVGDNIVANAKALCRLSATNENNTFNKLMVIQAGSIVEAALDQIIYRAQNYTKEGVPNIPADDLTKIRKTEIERFNNIIQQMKTHMLLDGLGGTIYDDLHRLRKLRNRVHIQFDDKPEELVRDDHQAFSDKEVAWSLSLCIRVLKHLSQHFPRPKALGVFAHEVSIPKASSRTGTSSRAGLSSRPGPPAEERSMGGVRGLLVGSSSPEKRWLEECYPR